MITVKEIFAKKNEKLKSVYEKLRCGDSLSDQELRYGLKQFRTLEKMLSELGSHFFLATRHIREYLFKLEDIDRARKQKW